jgi:hypothetical protein
MKKKEIELKWKNYLMKTLFSMSADKYDIMKNEVASDLSILTVLGASCTVTLKNYLKDGRLKGKRVKDILDYLIREDENLLDVKLVSDPQKKEFLKKELSEIYRKATNV